MSERFVITNNNKGYVSVLDTENNLNLELFGVFLYNTENAKSIEIELDGIVCALNEQDRLLKENNIVF